MQPPGTPIPIVLADCAKSVSVERAIWEIATRLPAARFAPRVWLPADPEKDPFAEALGERGLPVDRMPAPGSTWGWRGLLGAWMRLRRVHPTLLHAHHEWPSGDGVSGALTEVAGVRHRVVSAHGSRDPHVVARASRRSLERADAVTTTCRAFAEQLVRESGVARTRIRHVPTGTDLFDEEVERVEARRIRDRLGAGILRPLWLCPGRLETHKGTAVFLEALGLVRERGLPFVAAVIGEGSLRESLGRRADELGLTTSVHFIEPGEDLGPALLAADAVVVPSLWEGLSGVLLQALMRGRPVIATAVGGAPDVIEHDVGGRLVPPGDAEAIAAALESFHRRPEAAQRLGREGARRAREELTWARVVQDYETVYDEVLGLASFEPERTSPPDRW
jgi:glycosyltransferase involved in cell wall biosynthesis